MVDKLLKLNDGSIYTDYFLLAKNISKMIIDKNSIQEVIDVIRSGDCEKILSPEINLLFHHYMNQWVDSLESQPLNASLLDLFYALNLSENRTNVPWLVTVQQKGVANFLSDNWAFLLPKLLTLDFNDMFIIIIKSQTNPPQVAGLMHKRKSLYLLSSKELKAAQNGEKSSEIFRNFSELLPEYQFLLNDTEKPGLLH